MLKNLSLVSSLLHLNEIFVTMTSCCNANASKTKEGFPDLKTLYDCAKNTTFPPSFEKKDSAPPLETLAVFDVYGSTIERPLKVYAHSVLRDEECPVCYEKMVSPCIMLRKRDANSADQICKHNVCFSCAEKIVKTAIDAGPAEISSCPLCRGHFCAVASSTAF